MIKLAAYGMLFLPVPCHQQNAHPVTSSAVLGGVSWHPEDVMVKLTVRMIVMRTAVVNKFDELSLWNGE